jgi:hypothetical protein
MPEIPKSRRFRFSLRTLFWFTLIVPLVIFAAHEHYQRIGLERRVRVIEQVMSQRQLAHESQMEAYRSLVDNQQALLGRYRRLATKP